MIVDLRNHKKILCDVGEITTGRFAELLVAKALGGTVVEKKNNKRHQKGYDIEVGVDRRIEVRSRVEGTDGTTPRITLTKSKMEICTDVVALRFSLKYVPIEAQLVAKDSLNELYKHYRQNDGSTAHINWKKFCESPGAEDILSSIMLEYDALDA